MTADLASAAQDQSQVAAENLDARQGFDDNPNPGPGEAAQIPYPPAPIANDGDDAPRLTPGEEKRQAIFAKAALKRQESLEDPDDLQQNTMGEYIPPFVANAEPEPPAPEPEPPKQEEQPQSYQLKVNGSLIPVPSREELRKLAEVGDDEDYSDVQLVKLAQKHVATSMVLDEVKAVSKSVRAAARTTDTTPSDPAANEDDEQPGRREPDPNQDQDRKIERAQRIQYGSPEEAAAAIREEIAEGVQQELSAQKVQTRANLVETRIQSDSRAFESANADIMQDEDLANVLYNSAVPRQIKADLVAAGLDPAKVDAVVGNTLRDAMEAYTAVAVSGKLRTRPPAELFKAAAAEVRQKFNRPAPVPNTTSQPAPAAQPAPALSRRVDAKRQLAPQPNRATVPVATAPTSGQGPARRSSVVAEMQRLRGRGPITVSR